MAYLIWITLTKQSNSKNFPIERVKVKVEELAWHQNNALNKIFKIMAIKLENQQEITLKSTWLQLTLQY